MSERVERLERRHRWLMRGMGAGLLVVGALAMMGQAPARPRVLEAEQFVVRDNLGRTRAVLYTRGHSVVLALQDTTERARLALDLEEDGTPNIRLYDEHGKERIRLSHRESGGSVFTFRDASGRSRVQLTTLTDGVPRLSMMDAERKERVLLTTGETGAPHLALMDTAAHERLVLALDDEGYARLTVRDKTRMRALLGYTGMHVMRKGRVVPLPEVSLVLFDEKGNIAYSKP